MRDFEAEMPRQITASKSGSTEASYSRFTHAISLRSQLGRLVGLQG